MLTIQITGPAGSGKTYWAQKLTKLLQSEGKTVVIDDEAELGTPKSALPDGADVVITTRITSGE